MDNISIRRITVDDIDELQKIGRMTFNETFAPWNSEANMKKYLEEVFSLERLTLELGNKNSEFYFAIFEKSPIGYLKINHGDAQSEIKDSAALEIERIYVLKHFFGKKVGQLLFETALSTATKREYRFVWLGVWEKNQRAISFYKKNGFTEFDKHIFKLGDDIQTDIMMKLELNQEESIRTNN